MPEQSHRAYIMPDIIAGLHHAATQPKEGRSVLAGIALDRRGLLAAADGFLLVVRKPDFKDGITWDGDPFSAIIPHVVAKTKLDKNCPIIVDAIALTVTFTPHKGEHMTMPLVQGTFPRWEALIPSVTPESKNDLGTFNPDILSQARKAMGNPNVLRLFALDKRSPAVAITEQNDGSYTSLAVIMPMYTETFTAQDVTAGIASFVAPVIAEPETAADPVTA